PSFYAKPSSADRNPGLRPGPASRRGRPAPGLRFGQRSRRRSGETLPLRAGRAGRPTARDASAGLGLATRELPAPSLPLDTLIVPGGSGVDAAWENAALLAWSGAGAGAARRIAWVCRGAFLLAAAGLFDGRRGVPHWGGCAEFARRFPAVR